MWPAPLRPRINPSPVDKETSHDDPPGPDARRGPRPPARPDRRGRPAAPANQCAGRPQGQESHGRPRTAHRYPGVVRTLRGGAGPVMIGRDGELRRLARLASSREPAVAIIAGE